MTRDEKLAELMRLDRKAELLRQELGISSPGKVTFLARLRANDESLVVAESDGFGKATTSVVEGNYPIDYITTHERAFATEQEAEEAAAARIPARTPSIGKSEGTASTARLEWWR